MILTMKVWIDVREPKNVFYLATKLKIPYKSKFLTVGDIETERVIFERKTVSDLIQSVYGQKVPAGYRKQRLDNQLKAMMEYCEKNQKVGWLLVSGSIEKAAKWFKKRKMKLNTEALYGALASATVRYGISVIWDLKSDEHLLLVAYKIAKKVDEGKLGVPRRLSLRKVHPDKRVALIANVLRVSPKIAERMFKQFGGLGKIIRIVEQKPQELWLIDGVGQKTIDRVRKLLGFA